MQIYISYTTEEKLISLSERLKYIAQIDNSYKNYIDHNIKSENLQLNLSFTLTQIILNLKFIDRSKKVFLEIINEYNQANKTSITFEEFENNNWIRTVAEEIVIPELIRHFIWQVEYYEKGNKPIQIPTNKNDLIRCLQIYYQKCKDEKLTIEKVELEKILSSQVSKVVTIDFLIERDVIGLDSRTELYYWKGNEYLRHLSNEIASTLWLIVGGEEATIKDFRKYFKYIQGAQIWVDDLGSFLSHKNRAKICELAALFLNSEEDLLKSSNEFSKIWFDATSDKHIDITTEIPVVQFNYESTFDFIESVNYHKWRFHEVFDHQSTRSYYCLLLQIIIANDTKYPTRYENVIRILKDTSRPFLIWEIYRYIQREFTFVIPYLLTDTELIPLAFKLIDKIEINEKILTDHLNADRKSKQSYEVKNQLWIDMFDFIFEHLDLILDDIEKGELIAKILIDLTEKVFSVNVYNKYDINNHNSLRKRYNVVLKILNNKRITNTNYYSELPIKPRVVGLLLSYIIKYIKRIFEVKIPNRTEFLTLKSGLIDLSIEILRLSNLRISESELLKTQNEINDSAQKELVFLLETYLSEFYTQIEIDVQVYNKTGVEKRKARRGANQFGFEIIDWGYLYLHFEKYDLLQKFSDSFNDELKFNTIGDKYDEQNKEQCEKIKLYLKSLMLAYISINQNKDLLEIDCLPVNTTLIKLEQWIREFSLKYSIDDISLGKIDVLNEVFNVLGYDMNYQHMTTLLFRSMNHFNGHESSNFVQEFFHQSTDMGRMLNAINIIDSKELRDIISNRIEEVRIEDFIKNSFTLTELKYALVEAVNSDNHWELAKPLIDRIRNHFQHVKQNDEITIAFLFEVNLLIAFKEKDFKKLSDLPLPKVEFQYQRDNKKAENLKQFYVALYKIYNDNKYDEAILILKSLLSDESKKIRYAFHLYRAETLKAINAS